MQLSLKSESTIYAVGGMVRCHNPVIKPLGFTNSGSASSFSARVQNQVLAGSAAYSLKKDGIPTEKNKLETEPNNYDVPSSMGDGTKLANPFLVPKLFWLDQYGSLQSLRYAAHGHGSNFALSVLDQRYRSDMTRQEAVALIEECFEQLRQRYVINSPQPPRIKCVDADGVIEIGCIENK